MSGGAPKPLATGTVLARRAGAVGGPVVVEVETGRVPTPSLDGASFTMATVNPKPAPPTPVPFLDGFTMTTVNPKPAPPTPTPYLDGFTMTTVNPKPAPPTPTPYLDKASFTIAAVAA